MGIADRYASAVHATSLKPQGIKGRDEDRPQTPDVLGAYGLADKALTTGKRPTAPDTYERVPAAPLAVPLARLLAGDARAVHEIVRILTELAFRQSYEMEVRVSIAHCKRMAQATLGWFQGGTCEDCGGVRYERAPGSPMLTGRECKPCGGTGKIPFEQPFDKRDRELATWMKDQVELSLGRAGPAAMRSLSARAALDLVDGDRRM